MPKCDFKRFIEITLRQGCSPVNLLRIFRTLIQKDNYERLLLVLAALLQS